MLVSICIYISIPIPILRHLTTNVCPNLQSQSSILISNHKFQTQTMIQIIMITDPHPPFKFLYHYLASNSIPSLILKFQFTYTNIALKTQSQIGPKRAQNDPKKAKIQKVRKPKNLTIWKLSVYMSKPQKHISGLT